MPESGLKVAPAKRKFVSSNLTMASMIKFKVNGYDFAERMLEDLMFEVEVDSETRQITSFGLSEKTLKRNERYLRGINLNHWISVGKDSTQDVIDEIYASGEADLIFADLNDDGTLEF